MFTEKEKSTAAKYRCWVSDNDRIISFSYIEGYELIEFKKYSDFQNYYYQKTYWGYRVQ